MPEWISWEEAVEVVARDFPIERAEGLLRAALLRGGAIKVRTTERGYTTKSPEGRYVPDNPDYPYSAGEPRPYRMMEDVDLRTLKTWLEGLTSDQALADDTKKSDVDDVRGAGSAEHQTREYPDQPDDVTYKTGAAGRPTSAHLVKAELQRRIDAGGLCKTLKQEAEQLSKWLVETHPSAAPMTPKTISNRFRAEYREAQNRARNEMKG